MNLPTLILAVVLAFLLLGGVLWLVMSDDGLDGQFPEPQKPAAKTIEQPKPQLTPEEKAAKVKHDHEVSRYISLLRDAVRKGNTKACETIADALRKDKTAHAYVREVLELEKDEKMVGYLKWVVAGTR